MKRIASSLAAVLLILPSAVHAQEGGPHARWARAQALLKEADDDSIAAINKSLADVAGSFESAEKNARPFVDDLLDWSGGWEFAKALPGKAAGYGTSLVNYVLGTTYAPPLSPDDFERHVRKTFVARVFDPEVFKRGVQGGVDAYCARLKEIEAKLLVDLRADVDDVELRMPAAVAPTLGDELLKQVDAAVDQVVSDAAVEYGFSAAKFCVSQWGGNVATNYVSPLTQAGAAAVGLSVDPYSFAMIGSGVLVGVGVEYALDKAIAAAGRDPAGASAAKVQAVLARASRAVFEGSEPDRSSRYVWFALFAQALDGTDDGGACDFAARAEAASTYLGLRPTLAAMHGARSCIRRRLAYRAVFDAAAPVGEVLAPERARRADAVIGEARAIRAAQLARLQESMGVN
jgi:hypothetical protein